MAKGVNQLYHPTHLGTFLMQFDSYMHKPNLARV